MKNLGLVFFPAFDWAISPTHPEREERLLYTRDQLMEEGLFDMPQIREYKPKVAHMPDLERIHIGVPDIKSLITDAHLVSAGGAITAAEAVVNKEVKRAFALIRPPGHHAMRVVHGTRGFCTINIEAIMIENLRKKYGIRKVAIVDTDVHHGDGTQDIYYHDPETLFISFHQDGRTLYPGSGFVHEVGSPNAFAKTINLPLPPGSGDEEVHYILDHLILPILDDFQPDLIINSAGQDNHYSDPLANMAVTAQGYARLAEKLKADIAVLEGGYSIEDALPYVNMGIILAMAGMDFSQVIEPNKKRALTSDAANMGYVKKLVKEWQTVWRERDKLKTEAIAGAGDFWGRRRRIYYDDSGIDEHQEEIVRLCPQCSGFLQITSNAVERNLSNKSAFIGIIMRDSCSTCRKQVYEKVLQAKKAGEFQCCFVQDQAAGILERI